MIFTNGFDSWYETHHEIVAAMTYNLNLPQYNGRAREIENAQGTGGLYELAKELTDKFENANENKEWDGEFFDEIELFLEKELG
jgi:hypothetical protein